MNSINSGYILVIDDNKDICDLLSHLLKQAGHETQQGYDGGSALKLLSQREPDVLLLDSIIPEPSGMAVLANAHLLYPQLPVIIITGNPGILSAVCAIKAGAWDYIPKPFDNNRVLELVNRAIQTRWGKHDSNCKANRDIKTRISTIMGHSSEIQCVTKDIIRVAHTDFSVVIQGETGTGKELIAKNIHLASRRAAGVFIPIDCGAIADSLIENELFGHEKGSYTGADQVRVGKFEAADGGTLFLDEIANMSLSAQAKLLRVLQERVIYRVGGIKPIPVNVRILAASNECLLDAVVNGKFREDLYYRLNEYSIVIPPLRKRHEDIVFLADRFMKETCIELGKEFLHFSIAAKETLLSYPWPGNVRELRAIIRRAALISEQEVGLAELGLPLKAESLFTLPTEKHYVDYLQNFCYEGKSLKAVTQITVNEIERVIIQETLKKTGNNKAEAARILEIDYKTLHSKLKKINGIGKNNYEQ
jgi:two-component system nitrogen regulation response regulator GlnG